MAHTPNVPVNDESDAALRDQAIVDAQTWNLPQDVYYNRLRAAYLLGKLDTLIEKSNQ